jgi:hypothetical protein
MARRVWAKIELMPFRYGVALAVGTVTMVALLVVGFMVVGGTPRKETPRPGGRSPLEAAAPTAPNWGEHVPPRRARPNETQVGMVRPKTPTPSPRARASRSAPRPSSTTTCPPNLRKWQWAWAMCKRKQNG